MKNLVTGLKSASDIREEVAKALLLGGFNNLSQGSAMLTLLENVREGEADFFNSLDKVLKDSFLSTAGNIYLDLIGNDVAVPRLGTSPAISVDTQRFFVAKGVLGDITGGKDLVLGPNVMVSAAGGVAPAYTVVPYRELSTDYPVWPANKKEIFVKIEAANTGSRSNVAANTLVSHNLPYSYIMTTNTKPILTGMDVETDENYRYRLFRSLVANQGSNRPGIIRASLEVPGVDSVLIQPFTQGPGSFTLIVIPLKGAGTNDLTGLVTENVNSLVSAGERFYVRLANTKQLKLSLRVFSSTSKAASASSVRTAVLEYLGGLNSGDPFVMSSCIARVLSDRSITDAQITAISVDGVSMSPSNINLKSDEIFIVPIPASSSIQVEVVR